MPPAHPARGMWDTLYLKLGEPETVLLRTHTSPVQIHLMETQKPPIYAVMPGPLLPPGHPRRPPPAGLPPDRGAGRRPRHHLRRPGRHHRGLHHGLLRAGHPLPAAARRTSPSPSRRPSSRSPAPICRGRRLPDLLGQRAGSSSAAAGWSTPTCSPPSASTPRSTPASPSASASTGWPRCATASTDMRILLDNDLRFLDPVLEDPCAHPSPGFATSRPSRASVDDLAVGPVQPRPGGRGRRAGRRRPRRRRGGPGARPRAAIPTPTRSSWSTSTPATASPLRSSAAP